MYNDVIDSVTGYKSLKWKSINIEDISNELGVEMEHMNPLDHELHTKRKETHMAVCGGMWCA